MKAQFKILLFGVISLAILGIVQFLICTIIAMIRFPEGYSFFNNFLSELGMMGHAGHSVFNGSMITLGCMLLPMFVLLQMVDPRENFSVRATSAFGIMSALGAIGVGTWTFDRQLVLHSLSMAMWLLPMLYMVVTFFFAASTNPIMGAGFVGTSLVMVCGMIGVLMNTKTTSVQLIQKSVVLCGMVWLSFIVAYIWQSGVAILNDWIEDDGSREKRERSYFSALTSGRHRRD